MRQLRDKGDRKIIRLPDSEKEYLVIYTTEYDDTYILETIGSLDFKVLKEIVKGHTERVAEAHHIDYFVNSLNNDASNQLIVCPNHHSIIHDVDPVFDRKKLLYTYANGYEERLVLNKHL